MPIGSASAHVRSSAETATTTVSHSRSPITSVTGRRHSIEKPKLPSAICFIHFQYGLGQPIYVQYWKWMKQIAEGNFGFSMEWRRPVTEVMGERLWLTVVVAVSALLLTWVLALPIGIYSAVRQYSLGDYAATFVGFIGLAVPNFLLALVLLYLGFVLFNAHIGGLFSPEYQDAPWSWARAWDLA